MLPRCVDIAQEHPPPLAGPEDWAASHVWLLSVVDIAKRENTELFSYFRFDKKVDYTVTITGWRDALLARLFPKSRRESAVPMAAGEDELIASDHESALQAMYLYHSVLLHVLRKLFPKRSPEGAASRFSKPSLNPDDVPRVMGLLGVQVFHSSLLVVAAMLVQAIQTQDPAYLGSTPDMFLRIADKAEFQNNMLALWNACRWFEEAFTGVTEAPYGEAVEYGTAPEHPLPPLPGRLVLGRLKRLCEEREVLKHGSIFYAIFTQMGDPQHDHGFTEGDFKLLVSFLDAYVRRACALATMIANVLVEDLKQLRWQGETSSAAGSAGMLALFPQMTYELVASVISSHMDLAFNQHLSVVTACCLYILAKAARIPLTFNDITAAFLACPDHSADIFEKHVELRPAESGEPPSDPAAREAGCGYRCTKPATLGGIRAFYNMTFLSRVRGLVREVINKHMPEESVATLTTGKASPPASPLADTAAAKSPSVSSGPAALAGDIGPAALVAPAVVAISATAPATPKPAKEFAFDPPSQGGDTPSASLQLWAKPSAPSASIKPAQSGSASGPGSVGARGERRLTVRRTANIAAAVPNGTGKSGKLVVHDDISEEEDGDHSAQEQPVAHGDERPQVSAHQKTSSLFDAPAARLMKQVVLRDRKVAPNQAVVAVSQLSGKGTKVGASAGLDSLSAAVEFAETGRSKENAEGGGGLQAPAVHPAAGVAAGRARGGRTQRGGVSQLR